jgi:hypothetical protein
MLSFPYGAQTGEFAAGGSRLATADPSRRRDRVPRCIFSLIPTIQTQHKRATGSPGPEVPSDVLSCENDAICPADIEGSSAAHVACFRERDWQVEDWGTSRHSPSAKLRKRAFILRSIARSQQLRSAVGGARDLHSTDISLLKPINLDWGKGGEGAYKRVRSVCGREKISTAPIANPCLSLPPTLVSPICPCAVPS